MDGATVYGASEWISRIASGAPEATTKPQSKTLKLFVAGDKSQVGKSSTCLGILSCLLHAGYAPEELAYIKPVTQCEKPQLIQTFCEEKGIDAVPIGPVVFYSGFTRRFLSGNTKDSSELLADVVEAVEKLVNPKRKIIVVDGVGFPAVGSIVGVSNAVVAKALNSPVLVVCPKGVGNAVDSFNLNEAYFAHNGCNVIGAVFNRLPTEGFYALPKCKEAVESYFKQYRHDKSIYGFIPEAESPENLGSFIQSEFQARFNAVKLVQDLRDAEAMPLFNKRPNDIEHLKGVAKRRKVLSREEIVNEAKAQGGKGG